MGIDLNTTNRGGQAQGQREENDTNNRMLALAGFAEDYGAKEARQALANADAGGLGGGGGGGGGITQAETTAAINDSSEVQDISTNTADALTNLINVLASVGNAADTSAVSSLIGLLKLINESQPQPFTNSFDFAGTTNVNATIEALPANAGRRRVTIQNRSVSRVIYVRVGNVIAADLVLAYAVPPLGTIVLTDINAQRSVHIRSQANITDPYYIEVQS